MYKIRVCAEDQQGHCLYDFSNSPTAVLLWRFYCRKEMGNMYRFLLLILLVFCTEMSVFATCPDGYTEYLGPASNLVRNANGECSELCGSGITSLNTSNGYRFDLFATKNTIPAINIKYGDEICYADLITGSETGTLNIKVNDTTYHANVSTGELCPVTRTLSYSCGDGATGTPPDSIEVAYGDLYTAPYDAGTCRKDGYYISGWKIDSSSLSNGYYYNYTYSADKTMVAQWKANSYGAPYFCNYCAGGTATSSSYVTGTYASNFTPTASLSCLNPFSQTLQHYKVLDVWGNDTGETLTPGTATKWKWAGNIQLRAIWSEPEMPSPTTYTLSYSCGDGATGAPPASHSVVYNQLYTAPYDAGTCRKDGYYISGWKIDSSSLSNGYYYNYTYSADKTMVAQWKANSYGGAYLCNNGTSNSSYLTGTFGGSVTPSATVCTATDGTTFAGYKILDVWGNDTGDVVASGASMTWKYPSNIRLQAIWE